MATVFLNGKLLGQDEARLSAFDAAVQHGVGLFETMSARLEDGRARVFRLEEHLERLIASVRELGLSESLKAPALAGAVERTVVESGIARARVRLTITGGDLNLLGRVSAPGGNGAESAAAPVDPTIMIVAQPATEYPPEMFERGVMATIADLKVNPLDPLAGHKTINYWGRLRELQAAATRRAGEALVFQVTNHLAGGCVSNAFVVKDGELVTPIAREEEGDAIGGAGGGSGGVAIPSPVLPGITRGWVLEWAARRRMKVTRRMVAIDDVLGADEVFLTNSSWGVLPVVRVEKHEVGDGEVGEVTREVRGTWEADTAE
jgi:branched-chain amino acid aminotransferase